MSDVTPPIVPDEGTPPEVTPVVETPEATPPTTPPETSQEDAEDEGWDEAFDEAFPGLSSANTDKKHDNEQDDPDKDPETPPETPPAGEETPPETPPEANPAEPKGEEQTPATDPAQAAIEAARQIEEARAGIAAEVREKMFKDVATDLVDKNGTAIRSVEDVLAYDNPETGQPFTYEEASLWFLNAREQLRQTAQQTENVVNQVTEVHVKLMQEGDQVEALYGDFLEKNPEIAKELQAEYTATLVRDPDSGLIVRVPLSLKTYYDRALKPYMEQAAKEADAAKAEADRVAAEAAAKAEADKKAAEEEEERKARQRTARSDIYGQPAGSQLSAEEKEWEEAQNEYFDNL